MSAHPACWLMHDMACVSDLSGAVRPFSCSCSCLSTHHIHSPKEPPFTYCNTVWTFPAKFTPRSRSVVPLACPPHASVPEVELGKSTSQMTNALLTVRGVQRRLSTSWLSLNCFCPPHLDSLLHHLTPFLALIQSTTPNNSFAHLESSTRLSLRYGLLTHLPSALTGHLFWCFIEWRREAEIHQ